MSWYEELLSGLGEMYKFASTVVRMRLTDHESESAYPVESLSDGAGRDHAVRGKLGGCDSVWRILARQRRQHIESGCVDAVACRRQ